MYDKMDEIIPKMSDFVLFFAAFPVIAVEICNKNKGLFCKDMMFHDNIVWCGNSGNNKKNSVLVFGVIFKHYGMKPYLKTINKLLV